MSEKLARQSAKVAKPNLDRMPSRKEAKNSVRKIKNSLALICTLMSGIIGTNRGVGAQEGLMEADLRQKPIPSFPRFDDEYLPAIDVFGNPFLENHSPKADRVDKTEKFLPDPQYVERQPVSAETQNLLDEIKRLTGGKTEFFEPLKKAELWEGDTTPPQDYVHLDECQDLLRLYIEGIKQMPDFQKSEKISKNLYPDYIVWRSTTYMGTGGTNAYTVVESNGKQRVINILRLTSQKFRLDKQLPDLPYGQRTMGDRQQWFLMHELGHGPAINDDPIFWNYSLKLWNNNREIKNQRNLLKTCVSQSRRDPLECNADLLSVIAQFPDNFITIYHESPENIEYIVNEPGLQAWLNSYLIPYNQEIANIVQGIRTNPTTATPTFVPSVTPSVVSTIVPTITTTSSATQNSTPRPSVSPTPSYILNSQIYLPFSGRDVEIKSQPENTRESSGIPSSEVPTSTLEPGSIHILGHFAFVMMSNPS